MALEVHTMLSNGMGGHDWAGLPLVCEWLGITDIDGLLLRLRSIRRHMAKPDEKDETE